ncbi:unnamed protein product [Ceutorhynchus assimilis]|uniref:Thyroglobulin type-1 domain-containing protein n=1 Tax=Ceutorhynchus assimilis TaxID=467358 RepID=A0A9N9MRE2_9CUCU|nr:unnamed protein product [Ceutorhynchus assimilis]
MYSILFKICFFLFSLCVSKSIQSQCPGTLITDLNQKSCTDRATNETAYYLDRTKCIPKCSIYPTDVQDGSCATDPNGCISGYVCESRCGPPSQYRDTVCETDADCKVRNPRASCSKYCVLPVVQEYVPEVPCMAYHANLPDYKTKWWTAKKFKPVCDDDGKWAPKQCKGGLQGRCMCYSADGHRLFGQALFADSANMTCACSRKISDLESSGRNYLSLHCDSMGNFEKLQCDIEKEICWCVEPFTGDLTAPVVPYAAMKKLPCYAESDIGSQYLRQCESKKYASTMVTVKLKAHGVKIVESDSLLCDNDGSYGAYSVTSGIAYCTWRNNTKIGTWQTNLSGMKGTLTCNCARDFYMYGPSQDCEGSGNYVLLQNYVDENKKRWYYCVGEDGFAKTDLLEDSTTNCTLYY